MKKKLIALAAAAVAIIPVAVSPASATAGAAEVVFSCTASLPNFPTSAGQGECRGSATLPSAGAGALAGVADDGEPYVVGGGGTNNFTARFNYEEPCIANEPPVAGTANGEATITGLSGVKGLDAQPVTATAKINFNWTRGGLTAAVVITGGSISFSDGTSEGVLAGAATAAFAPILQAHNTCPNGGPLEAVVAGEATIVVD